jgi:glycosyltransferase involved in cell wall biosynthesis
MTAAPRTPIRIVRMIARLNVGGPAQHVVWLTAAMNNADFETTLVTGVVAPGEQDMSGFATRHGVAPLIIQEMSREISPADAITIVRTYRLFRRLKPDVVHTHTAKAGTIGRVAGLLYRFLTPGTLIGRPRRVRFIHTYHGHIFHSYYGRAKTRLFLAIERFLARVNTHRILVLSEQQLRELRDEFRIGRPEQFEIVRLGIDLEQCRGSADQRSALRRELGIGDREHVVGIVGRLTAIKNHEMFLRAAGHFAPGEAKFVIFGDGADRAALERRVRDLGIDDRVIFAGTREPAEIYASLDVVALTSLNEGTPLTLIEAMANGRPIVSTAVGGVVDLLGNIVETIAEEGFTCDVRERGITVRSGDAVSFACALRRLLVDQTLQESCAANGKAYAASTYSKERLIADIARVTRGVLS